MQVYEIFKDGNLLLAVDPFLLNNNEGDELEGVRFLKIGLLCVQEITRLRPTMSSAFKMLTNKDIDIEEKEIVKPGRIASFMDLKVRNRNSSNSFFSGESPTTTTSSTTSSPQPPPLLTRKQTSMFVKKLGSQSNIY